MLNKDYIVGLIDEKEIIILIKKDSLEYIILKNKCIRARRIREIRPYGSYTTLTSGRTRTFYTVKCFRGEHQL